MVLVGAVRLLRAMMETIMLFVICSHRCQVQCHRHHHHHRHHLFIISMSIGITSVVITIVTIIIIVVINIIIPSSSRICKEYRPAQEAEYLHLPGHLQGRIHASVAVTRAP